MESGRLLSSELLKMRKLITLTVLAAALAVGACNTVSGVGKDVQAAGKAVSSTAEDAKH
jgi:predicted small secreted protein